MLSIFQTRPDAPKGDYSSSHEGRGSDYHQTFKSRRGRELMWRMEQVVLTEWISRISPRSIMDFACGTGRITQVLKQIAPRADICGVDVSESMLDEARRAVPEADFVLTDGRPLSKLHETSKVELITAIRFFANAEQSLRESAADDISNVVIPQGFVIVNNHRNFWSPSYLARRLKPNSAAPGCLNSTVVELFVQRGFRVIGHRSFGILPQSDDRSYLTSWNVAECVERRNARSFSNRHRLGVNTLWLFEKSD